MSFLNIAAPTINLATVARPLVELGFLGTFVLVFEPLLKGLLQAGLLLLKPRKSLDERKASANFDTMMTINRMASDIESSDPSLAAELRAMASHS